MLRPELSTRPTAPTAPAEPVRIMPTGSGAGMNFAAEFNAVRSDVMQFIENGSQESAVSGLSVEGNVYRNSVQPAQQDGEETVGPLQQEFLTSIAPWAQETGKRLGVSPEIVSAHAALESGWGRKPLKQADGGDTNNLFGIKAGGNWRGDVSRALTTEYEDGGAVPKVERFRSYPDRAAAFRDYAQLLSANPRYRAALNAGGDARIFAQGLVQGGYATDPAYADKLVRTAARIQSAKSGE
ncbi:flagellar assembly peptidoglycan hydrolase FlgJ [Herbaspirillum sp. HC18]|nr:flagellar assembly peptidoglycan hydrolase FlgJ [Herbaspirillum sp. HC18]